MSARRHTLSREVICGRPSVTTPAFSHRVGPECVVNSCSHVNSYHVLLLYVSKVLQICLRRNIKTYESIIPVLLSVSYDRCRVVHFIVAAIVLSIPPLRTSAYATSLLLVFCRPSPRPCSHHSCFSLQSRRVRHQHARETGPRGALLARSSWALPLEVTPTQASSRAVVSVSLAP